MVRSKKLRFSLVNTYIDNVWLIIEVVFRIIVLITRK